jgi:uncharacterized protein (TIGR01777 family)
MRIAVTGAGGFIGGALVRCLSQDGHSAVAVARGVPDPAVLEGADAIVHLAGEPVAQRWTAAAKQRIRASRVGGALRLVEALASLSNPPATLVSASAIGYYGSRGDEVLTESSPPGSDFLASVCAEWEDAAARAAQSGIRVVTVRIGMVLGPRGGALAKMLLPFRLGLGGRLGSGRQWMSWIHLDDLVALIRFALGEGSLTGPVNATAPEPVTNAEFTRELGRALGRPAVLPVPAFALRLLYGEMAEVLLSSQRVLPAAAQAAGFSFRHARLAPALRHLLAG